MINITLSSGEIKQYEQSVDGYYIAKSISSSLAKSALAIKINNQLTDLSTKIIKDAEVKIITANDSEALEIFRHDTAHVLAQAVKDLYPTAQITIGPAIEDGFYYDIAIEQTFSLDDLKLIEAQMVKIIKRNDNFIKEEWSREEAIRFFKEQGEHYKAEIIQDINQEEKITLYRQGDFIDLCKGPHGPNTGRIKAFKLLKVAGAYWRGDSKNPMLQRIYGTAWATQEQLQLYLTRLKEAEEYDHRKIGKELDLFHLQEEAPGMVFWHHKGWTIYLILEEYIRFKLRINDYIEVKTPILVDKSLWQQSGHWDKFRQNMFTSEIEDKIMALKPMNCPCHVQIFNQGIKSYRDLPIRMAEFGTCHRNESSGSLHGIMRVRGFVQDDAHIFCEPEMITTETIAFCQLLQQVYNDFGFKEITVKFSDRPLIRAGDDSVWDLAEKSLKEAIEATGLKYIVNPGEGAFYGPKLEFVLKDSLGRDWQCGTLQVDFILPARLNATYIGRDGNKYNPVMLHRALLGTFERFIGMLLEHHKGRLPLWLAPIQVAILTITNDTDEYATEIKDTLNHLAIRSVLDISNEKINYKIRHYSLQKVPIILVIGKKEAECKTIAVREANKQQILTINELVDRLKAEAYLPK